MTRIAKRDHIVTVMGMAYFVKDAHWADVLVELREGAALSDVLNEFATELTLVVNMTDVTPADAARLLEPIQKRANLDALRAADRRARRDRK